MVNLTGSEKQIQWAEQIRTKWLEQIDRALPRTETKRDPLRKAASLIAAKHIIENTSDASMFISHRERLWNFCLQMDARAADTDSRYPETFKPIERKWNEHFDENPGCEFSGLDFSVAFALGR